LIILFPIDISWQNARQEMIEFLNAFYMEFVGSKFPFKQVINEFIILD